MVYKAKKRFFGFHNMVKFTYEDPRHSPDHFCGPNPKLRFGLPCGPNMSVCIIYSYRCSQERSGYVDSCHDLPPSLPTYLPTSRKSFSIVFFKFTEMKFRQDKYFPMWKKNAEKMINGKKSNFKFQNRGIFGKKMFCQVIETSVIISV